jgi:hypothetical protein
MCSTFAGHSKQHRSFFTLCFLLANKHQTSYEDVFRHTVSETAKTWCECFSNNFYADFEIAIHNAVTTVWPGCEVKACRFHFGQSWWRKVQSLGLSKRYGKNNSEVKSVLEENIRTIVFTTGGSERLLCVGLYIQPSDRQTSGRVLRIAARKLH